MGHTAQSRGFIYATTGKDYTVLARRSARNLREVMPDASIDLFTDQEVDDPVFDQVHRLNQSSHRPKMEAMLRSRFDRNVLLDADTIPIGDVMDLFDLLDHCHIAAALAYARPPRVFDAQNDIPRSFPYLNGGVIAFRRSPRMMRLIAEWQKIVVHNNLKQDQTSLRELVFRHRMPLIVLPHDYNLLYLGSLEWWDAQFGAPLILHVRNLHKNPPGDPELPFDLTEVLGPSKATRVKAFIEKAKLRSDGFASRNPHLRRDGHAGVSGRSSVRRACNWLRRQTSRLLRWV